MEDLILVLDGEEELELVLSSDALAYNPTYSGDYEVTPSFTEQVLETSGMLMTDDVTVHEIPVTQTTNEYGGKTVVIG